MAIQFNNFKTYLTSVGYTVDITLDEFKKTSEITYKCKDNHTTTMKSTSFMNKKIKTKDNPEQLCTDCYLNKNKQSTFEQDKKEILKVCGHKLVSVDNERNAVYICKNCGNENQTFITNLKRNKGNCPKCQNQQFKNTDSNV